MGDHGLPIPRRPTPVRRRHGGLAALEHRGQSCKQVVISDSPSSTVIEYTCSGGGFGRTKLTLLTPRSLRIETQGISSKYPFNYVIQARRIGDCPAH